MRALLPSRNFVSLSVKDLLDAREAYHVHLLQLENVIATAIGRYRIVKTDPRPEDGLQPQERGRDEPRTLANSEVRSYSWPCVMVFVDRWIKKEDFGKRYDDIVPPRLYMPDGRVVPTCVIKAEKQSERVGEVQMLRFPEMMLGGGYPSLSEVQGQTRVATIGCLVTNGDNIYALTNAHVAGDAGRELFTLVRGRREVFGRTAADKVLTKIPFEQAYPGFPGPRSVLNLDAALVRVEDATRWTSQVYGIGQFDELADLNVDNVTLDLIGCSVVAFGAASGEMRGEIQGLYYRYRSVGGQDQLADLLIGPRADAAAQADLSGAERLKRDEEGCAEMARELGRHGNSGAVWFLEQKTDEGLKRRPIALHWGGQSFVSGDSRLATQYAMASSLGVICRDLNVEIIRDLNIGLSERWGKVGHYKVGQLACRVETEPALQRLLERNLRRISFESDIDKEVASGLENDDFVPLADVSDLVWKKRGGKFVRGLEGPNHFADMDQPSPAFADKSLLQLSEDAEFLDPEKWNDFYESLGIDKRHRGLLPFRIWQFFDEMLDALEHDNLGRYVAAAGVMAHYVGDACQPLHVSMLHDGMPNGRGKGVHSAYETKMLDRFAPDLNQLIDGLVAAKKPKAKPIKTGKAAAHALLELMVRSIKSIPPRSIIDVYEDQGHKVAELWDAFGKKTADRILDGSVVLASLWRGAWEEKDGPNRFSANQLRAISIERLERLYLDEAWVPSVTIDKMSLVASRLVVSV